MFEQSRPSSHFFCAPDIARLCLILSIALLVSLGMASTAFPDSTISGNLQAFQAFTQKSGTAFAARGSNPIKLTLHGNSHPRLRIALQWHKAREWQAEFIKDGRKIPDRLTPHYFYSLLHA